jgi:hypothetical protein
MVSIGLPEKAQALIHHLELEPQYGTHTMLYVDDVHNTIYDALQLNRGLQRTFFHIATPYSFLQRIQSTMTAPRDTSSSSSSPSAGNMMNLMNVLSKWKDGMCTACFYSTELSLLDEYLLFLNTFIFLSISISPYIGIFFWGCINTVLLLPPTAIYIPPKQSQALLQGGTFVLRNQQTLYAHYDPSTAAHAPISTVLDIAMQESA